MTAKQENDPVGEDLADPIGFLMTVMARAAESTNLDGLSRLDHALQCAANAERNGASAALVTASLLHDIGSILRSDFPQLAGDPDRGHEVIGAEALERWFGPEVTEPIALHVMAKRYLVGAEAGYGGKLSAASVASLEVQGLPLTPAEGAEFLARPFADDALALRRWDEDAKTPGATTPGLDHFKSVVQTCLKPEGLLRPEL